MLNSGLHRAFNPDTVAVVGDKRQLDYMWLRSLSTFKGRAYSVQVDPSEIPNIEALGVKNYTSLLDIPGQVDYVIVAVPRTVAPRILADCIKKGVGAATFFTSGFAETGTEEGTRLQEQLTRMAKEARFNLIGPNCMGIFNPSLGLRHSPGQPTGDGGTVGFISQSGTHASYFSIVGASHGVLVSKSVSYGNAVVLDCTDYLEYLAQDEPTRIIGMYIEGVRDGRRFSRVLRQVALKKPVVIWKGGQTPEGARATASHTASLAQAPAIWQGLMRQCGAIPADSLDQLVDAIKALLYIKPTGGDRVGLVAMTGGQSVVVTDSFAWAGLRVPLLSDSSYRELATFFSIIGGSYRNPLDISSNFDSVDTVVRMLDILDRDPNVDVIVMELSLMFLALTRGRQRDPGFYERLLEALGSFKERSAKAFAVILMAGNLEAEVVPARAELQKLGIASFASFERGALALRKMVDYHRFRQSLEPQPAG